MEYYKYIKENIFNKPEMINEVRLPKGYFRIVNGFMLPGKDNFDVIFSRDKIVQIDPEFKSVSIWNAEVKEWLPCSISYSELMKNDLYAKFKQNTTKLSASQMPKTIPVDNQFFTTTVRAFNKRAEEEGLEPGDRINVTVV